MAKVEATANSPTTDWGAKVAAVLSALLTVLAPVAGALAAASGGLARVLRNEPGWTVLLAAAILGGFLLMLLGFFA